MWIHKVGAHAVHPVQPLDTLAPPNCPFLCLAHTLGAHAYLQQSSSPPLPSLHPPFSLILFPSSASYWGMLLQHRGRSRSQLC